MPASLQRHAEIVVQLGVIGPHGQQPQIGGDRLVEPAGAMGLRGQAQLLDELSASLPNNGVGPAEAWDSGLKG